MLLAVFVLSFATIPAMAAVEGLQGEGTQENPYTIGNLEELVWFRDDVNAGNSYKGDFVALTASIDIDDCNDVTLFPEGTWIPIGTSSNPFMGSFDGNDNTISNLWAANGSYSGFFGKVGTWMEYAGEIKDINFSGVTVVSDQNSAEAVGSLAGYANAVVSDIHIKDALVTARADIGGIVGDFANAESRIENCSFEGTINCGYGRVGGVAGKGYGTINNCRVNVELTGAWAAGGIIGLCNSCTVTNNYVEGSLTANVNYGDDYKIGGIVGTLNESNSQTIENNYCNATVSNYAHPTVEYFPVIGMYNIDATEATMVDLSNNSWNREIFDTDTVALVGMPTDDGTGLVSITRNNNLVVLDSDLEYIDALDAADVTVLEVDGVTEVTAEEVEAAVKANIPELPTATVTEIPEEDLAVAPDLTFALKFFADEVTPEQLAYYGDWYADFELTLNKTAIFDDNDSTANGYLAGEYGEYGWVTVPFTPVTLEANKSLKIMEYASELMGKPGLKYTYREVYEAVKEFNCGVYFKDAFLANNKDLEVTLELRMYNPEDETESYTIGETYKFSGKGKYIFGYTPFVVRNMPIKQYENKDGKTVDYCEVAFFAGIDSLDYQTIGFKVEADNGTEIEGYKIPAVGEDGKYYVYKDITVTGSEGSQTVTAEKIDSYRIFGIQVPFEKSVYDNKDVWFTPYAENFDGTTTYGLRYRLPDIYTK